VSETKTHNGLYVNKSVSCGNSMLYFTSKVKCIAVLRMPAWGQERNKKFYNYDDNVT
jgi:hypothetical protein